METKRELREKIQSLNYQGLSDDEFFEKLSEIITQHFTNLLA